MRSHLWVLAFLLNTPGDPGVQPGVRVARRGRRLARFVKGPEVSVSSSGGLPTRCPCPLCPVLDGSGKQEGTVAVAGPVVAGGREVGFHIIVLCQEI